MTTPAIEYEQSQPTLGEPKKKRQQQEAQIETPQQAQAFIQSHAIHELNTRIAGFSPTFVLDHPHVVAHSVFSTMSTPKLQALAPYLSQTWDTLKSANSYAGVSGGLIAARADALQEQDPKARAFKLLLLDLLAQQSPDEQQATAALIRQRELRSSYESSGTQPFSMGVAGVEPLAPGAGARTAYEQGGAVGAGQHVLDTNPQAAAKYQAEGKGNAVLQGLGDFGKGLVSPKTYEDIWHGLVAQQRRVFGTPETSSQETKVVQAARDKLTQLEGLGNIASGLKARGISQAEISDALQSRRSVTSDVKKVAEALIEARHTAPGGALGGATTAAVQEAAARASAVPVGSVKVAWTSTGSVEIQTDNQASPDTRLAAAVAETLFPGTTVSYISHSMIGQALTTTMAEVNKGMSAVFGTAFGALGKVLPPAKSLLEYPANFLGHIGSDVGAAFADAIGMQPTNPLYSQMQNVGALLVQFEGLKGLGKLGEAVKLARTGPREVTMPGIEPTLAARLLKPSLRGIGSSTAEVRTAADAQGVGRLDIPPESVPFMGSQLGRVSSAVADYLGRPRISSTEALLTRRLGGPIIGRIARTVADLVSKPKDQWFDSGVGARRVSQIARVNDVARAAGEDPAGAILEWSKNTVDPRLARQLADSQTKMEVRDTLVRWSSRIDQEHIAELQKQATQIGTELKRTDLSPDDRGSLVAQRQAIQDELAQNNPDAIMWEVPKSSGLHRVINRVPYRRLGAVLGALADPQKAFGVGKDELAVDAKRPIPLTGPERSQLFDLSAAQDIRKLTAEEQVRFDELARKQQEVWNYKPPEFKGRKTFRISTLRPFMDDMPKATLYPPSMLGYGAEQAAHNVEWISKAFRRIGVRPEIIRSALSDMTKLKPADYAGSFAWMKSLGSAIESSLHIAPDLKATLSNFFARQETERSFGWFTDANGAQSPILVDSETGTALPTMPTELLRNPIPMFSHDLAIEATSFTRYWVRRGVRAGYKQVLDERGNKTLEKIKTPGGVLARTAMLPYKLSKAIMWGSTAILKPLVLVSRTLFALPVRIQGEQWFRNYFAGSRGFAREAMFGKESAFPVPFNDLGGIVRDTLTPMEGARSVYPTTDTGQYLPGNPLPQDVTTGIWRRLKMFQEDPIARNLATLGPEEFQKWFQSPAAKPYFDAMNPIIEASDAKTIAEYTRRKWAEVTDFTNGDPRLINAIATGTFKERGSLVADQIANQMADRTQAQEYSSLTTEYLTVKDRIQTELQDGNVAAVQGLQGRLEEILARQTAIEDSITQLPSGSPYHPTMPFDPAANDVSLDDQAAWTDPMGGVIDRMFNDGEYRLPRTVTTEKTVVDGTKGRLAGVRDGISTLSQVMYRGLKPTSFFDRHGTRGAFFYQAYAARFAEAVSRGLEPDVARFEAMHRAATQTADHLYDLSVRSSVHKFLGNTFWFAPAYQEILSTWLWKLPSRGYWPLGMAWILGDAHALLQFAHNEGWISSIPSIDPKTGKPSKTDVLKLGFLAPLFKRLGVNLGDAGNDTSVIYGYPSGANVVSSGLPGISSVPAESLAMLTRKYGGMWKSISDVLLPYGMDVSLGPGALNYGYSALTGDAPPWEVFSKDYQQQIHDLAFDDSAAMAFHKLQSEGVHPPQLSDYPDTTAGHNAYHTAMYGQGGWLQKWQNETHSIFKARNLVRAIGASVFPMSLHITDTYREALNNIWQKVTGGKPFDKLTPAQQQDVQTHLNSWVAGHPYSGAYAVARTTAGEQFRDLPYADTGSKAFYDQFYNGQRKVRNPEEYRLTVMAHESYRQFSGQINAALKGISPTLNWKTIVTQGYKKRTDLTAIQDRIENWRLANPKAWGIIQQDSQVWAAQQKTPTKTFEAQRLSAWYAEFGHFSKLFTTQGVTDKAYKAMWGKVGALFTSDAQVGGVTLGPLATPLEKNINKYRLWVKPYYDSLDKLYNQASILRANHLDPSHLYAQARNITNEWARKAKQDHMPAPEAVSWGNLSPHEQTLARYHWATEPIGWLTTFQRTQAGYHGSEGQKYDKMFNGIASFDTKFQQYLKSANVSSSSKYYATLQSWRYTTLTDYAQKNFGKEGVTLFRLGEASPYIRLRYLGVGQDNPAFVAVSKAADYIVRTAVQKGFSASGSSTFMDYYRQWLFPIMAELENPQSPKYDKGFARLMANLNLATRSLANPVGLLGPSLYDAVFFNQFKTSFTPDHPKAFMDLAGVQGSQYVQQQQKAQSGQYQNAQGLAARAAQASGVPGAAQWAQSPQFWYILEHESGLAPNSTQAQVQQAAQAQNPTSSAYGIGQFLDSTWGTVDGTKTSDPYTQLEYTFKYIQNHYGSLQAAYAHKVATGWY